MTTQTYRVTYRPHGQRGLKRVNYTARERGVTQNDLVGISPDCEDLLQKIEEGMGK